MDDFDIRTLPAQRTVIFVASTTGQGDMPENMKNFWRFLLRRSLPANSLANLRFSVFGLGDSSYPIYNAAGRKLFQRVLNLGGTPLCARGDGDDQHDLGYDSGLDEWLPKLMEALMALHPLPPGLDVTPGDALLPARYKVEVSPAAATDPAAGVSNPSPKAYYGSKAARYTPFSSRVVKAERLTSEDHYQDVRQIQFDLSGSDLTYDPGDVLCVHPENDPDVVRVFLKFLDLSPADLVTISKASDSSPDLGIPSPVSALELFTQHLGILETPRRFFFEMLLHFATDERQIDRLKDFTSAEGQIDLYRYCQRERRTYVEVLEAFSSGVPPLSYLVELIPRLRPRQFSISSSLAAHPNVAEITVAFVEYDTPYKRRKLGVCSEYLKAKATQLNGADAGEANVGEELKTEGSGPITVPVWTQKGTFRKPKDWLQRPLILVGPGTGLAPFKGMVEERSFRRKADGEDASGIAPIVLFLGHRYSTKDYLYDDAFWQPFLDDGTLSHLFTAFSRDQPQKRYVQHLIEEQGALLHRLLTEENALFLLAGNANQMPKDVRDALLGIFQREGGMSEGESEQLMDRYEKTRRYQTETWS